MLVVAATKFEIADFITSNKDADILITGVGTPATVYHLTNKLLSKRYDVALQAGIGGAFSNAFPLASVTQINQDAFGDIGIYEKENFHTLFDTGFLQPNEFPFTNGWLRNKQNDFVNTLLPKAKGITVNKITDDRNAIKAMHTKFDADVESMEGAAFHYVCLQQKINFLQIRSISNYVGERDKAKWKMQEAITNLNVELKRIVQHIYQ